MTRHCLAILTPMRAGLLILSLLVSDSLGASEDGLRIVGAFYQPNRLHKIGAVEASEDILKAKEQITDGGSYVRVYLANAGAEPVDLTVKSLAGKTVQELRSSRQLIWSRLRPDQVPPGGEAELALCLRESLKSPAELQLTTSSGLTHSIKIGSSPAPLVVATIAFYPDLTKAVIYLESAGDQAALPTSVYVNGEDVSDHSTWYSDDFIAGTAVVEVAPPGGFVRGGFYAFRFERSGGVIAAAGIRALSDLSVFGTYGAVEFERYATAGLSGYNSFRQLDKIQLDQGERFGVRSVALTHGEPSSETIGHPGIFAYGLIDEPDAQDYGVEDVPMPQRVGHHAPQLLDFEAACRTADPQKPTTLTINLTFTPFNYFIYGPIADIPNPDCYPIIAGWSIRRIRDNLANIRQACKPGPFTYTYQASWEEYGKDQNRYIPGRELIAGGFDLFRDADRLRGFGRSPVPSEVRIQMLYAIGFGARGLFAWTDQSEMSGNVMFHGTDSLPSLWSEVGVTSRQLQLLAPLLEISCPVKWSSSPQEHLWLSTLWAGRDAAIVVSVNDQYISNKEGFTQTPLSNAEIVFPSLPWLSPDRVYRIVDGGLEPVDSTAGPTDLRWKDSIGDGKLYLVVRGDAVRENLVARYNQRRSDQASVFVREQSRSRAD